MTTWNYDFEEGQTKAVCSKCGVPWRYPKELKRQNDGFFYCPRCLEQTVLTRDKIQAESRRRREMPPPKFVQPPQYADDYLMSEAQILNLVIQVAPKLTVNAAPSAVGAAYAAVYLADLIIENKRPVTWVSAARTKLISLCDYMRTLQWGDPLGPSPTTTVTDARFGGVGPTVLDIDFSAPVGLAFAAAYQAVGDANYLTAADRAMYFTRACQCSDLGAVFYVVYPSGGGRYHTGGLAAQITIATGDFNGSGGVRHFAESTGLGLQLAARMQAIRGASYVYGNATSPQFASSTLAPISTMISEMVSFLTVGVFDDSAGGARVAPMVPSTPRVVYTPYINGGGGPAVWSQSSAQPSNTGGVCLAGLWAAGATTEANAYYDYVASFTSNSANRLATGASTIGNAKGTYDPTLTVASSVNFTAATETTGAGYDWTWAGYVAPLQSSRFPTAFKRIKDTLAQEQPSTTLNSGPPLYKYIGRRGASGLSFQLSGIADVQLASITGNVYRYAPKSFGDQFTNPSRPS